MTKAPKLATWLLVRFSSDPHGEAIAGDLMEQYAERPSRLWYWQQVLSAIAADVVTTVGGNPWRTLSAITMGWMIYAAASIPVPWLIRSSRPIAYQWISAIGLDRLDPPGSAVWISLWHHTFIMTIVCVAIGWLVSRMNRRSAPAAASVFAVTLLLFEYTMIAFLFSTVPVPHVPTIELVAPAAFAISRPLGVLLGGVLGARTHEGAALRMG
jgi:hypothetical protein